MKKYLLVGLLVFLPFVTRASFDKNLKYGSHGTPVKEVQEFLTEQGVYTGPVTGNFFALTLKGVKNFQQSQQLPVTGIWGQAERTAANNIEELTVDNTTDDTVPNGWHFMDGNPTTTPPTIIVNIPVTPPVVDVCANIEGVQTVAPVGTVLQNGNCVVPAPVVVAPTPVAPVLLPALSADNFSGFDCHATSSTSAKCTGSGTYSGATIIQYNGQVVWDGSKPYGGVVLQTNSDGGTVVPDNITGLTTKTDYSYQITYKESGRQDTIVTKTFKTQ